MEKPRHIPVMVSEVLGGLSLKPNGIYVDGTVGYGGHASAILQQKIEGLQILGFDRDAQAIEHCQTLFAKDARIRLFHASYETVPETARHEGIEKVDGILLDLGASSPQFDDETRGFSLTKDGPLDMRFDPTHQRRKAADLLNTASESELETIFREYGEERWAKKIASAIVKLRLVELLAHTSQLKELVEHVIPRRAWPKQIHPATRVFQALRIAVNEELDLLKRSLPTLIELLKPGGRMVVISFHSLEDRAVKTAFRQAALNCVCPPELPECRCNKRATVRLVTKKVLTASQEELSNNPRSRSAKIRVIEHL